MSLKPVLKPSAAHPITVEPTQGRVTVRLGGRVVASSDRALTLQEASYPSVQYVPLEDVDAEALRPSEHTSYCPSRATRRTSTWRRATRSPRQPCGPTASRTTR